MAALIFMTDPLNIFWYYTNFSSNKLQVEVKTPQGKDEKADWNSLTLPSKLSCIVRCLGRVLHNYPVVKHPR